MRVSAAVLIPLALLAALLAALAPGRVAAQSGSALEQRALGADRQAREKRQAAADARQGAVDARRRARALAADAQRFERGATRLEQRLVELRARRAAIMQDIAAEQEGLTRLMAALQRMARRPAAAALLAPGDAVETARAAALAQTLRPRIAARTAALRARLPQLRALTEQAETQRAQLQTARSDLADTLAALDRLAAGFRAESGALDTEADAARRRARTLAAQAVDLAGLDAAVTMPDAVRRARAARSYRPSRAEIARVGYSAPASGRIADPFGRANRVGVVERGVTVRTRRGAVVTAPAPGRVAYAGPFRRQDGVVILEHENGMTSILSGLSRTDVIEGEVAARGLPLGRVGDDGRLYLELRRRGVPVDPMLYINGNEG